MVYVHNCFGLPLMPCTEAKAKHLLKAHKAKVVNLTPFTIRLNFVVDDITQPVTLGVDAGYKTIGLSASTENKVLFEGEVKLREDVVTLLEARRSLRRGRRARKTRYRASRFDNRVHSKNKGWFAPSVENRIGTHLSVIAKVCRLVPVSRIVVEVASFDIQKINNPDIEGEGYQKGEQLGFWNVREYVLWRDGHKCRNCSGKTKDTVLEVHHLVQRKDGGSDRPDNLITLCKTCHDAYHRGEIKLSKPKKGFKDATFMGTMKKTLIKRLRELYGSEMVKVTYGYITKNTRIENDLDKAHYIDARCIANHPKATPTKTIYSLLKHRSHNRQIHRLTILKGGVRKNNQCSRKIFGFRLFDTVLYNREICSVQGRRTSGYFDIRKPNGEKVSGSLSYKKLKLISRSKNIDIWKCNATLTASAKIL